MHFTAPGAAKISPATLTSSMPLPTNPLNPGSCPLPPSVTTLTMPLGFGVVRTMVLVPFSFTLSGNASVNPSRSSPTSLFGSLMNFFIRILRRSYSYTDGSDITIGSRNCRVCAASTRMPTTSQMLPAILAGWLSPSQITRQNRNPAPGSSRSSSKLLFRAGFGFNQKPQITARFTPMKPSKNAPRNHIPPAHAEQQPRRAHLRGKPGSNVGHHQQNGHRLKQHRSAHAPGHVDKRRVDVRKGGVVRPRQVRQVHQQAAEHPGKYAGETRP